MRWFTLAAILLTFVKSASVQYGPSPFSIERWDEDYSQRFP
jgi:hypothetical protein